MSIRPETIRSAIDSVRLTVKSGSLDTVREIVKSLTNHQNKRLSKAILNEMLIHATRCNRTEVASYLLLVNLTDAECMDGIALVWAVWHRNETVARALLKRSKRADRREGLAFVLAAQMGQARMVSLILHSHNPPRVDCWDSLAMKSAAASGFRDVVQVLSQREMAHWLQLGPTSFKIPISTGPSFAIPISTDLSFKIPISTGQTITTGFF